MSNIDWLEGAEFYAVGLQFKVVNGSTYLFRPAPTGAWVRSYYHIDKLKAVIDYQVNPNVSEVGAKSERKKTASEYLNDCMQVQKQRGEQYNSKGAGERSFAAAATAYNAITGHNLKGSDVCLMLQVLKDVRQYSDPTRLHEDSLLDKVSYASLHAEELNKELL